MSDRKRERLYAVVESLKPFLTVSPAKAFLTIKSLMEPNQDPFTSEEKTVRIHKKDTEECESCQA